MAKRPLERAKSYYFVGTKPWDAATPLRAMAQWVKRNPNVIVLAVGVYTSDEDSSIHVTLTVED